MDIGIIGCGPAGQATAMTLQAHGQRVTLYEPFSEPHPLMAASYLLAPFYQSGSRAMAALRDALFDPVSGLLLARRLGAELISGLLSDPLGKIRLSTDSLLVSAPPDT